MATFRAKPLEDRNLIEWSTSVELMIDYFELERSFDQVNYETIRTVSSNGDGNQIQEYQTVDLNTTKDTIYYQLKAYDLEENLYIINKTVVLIREELSSIDNLNHLHHTSLFPNPTTDYLFISDVNAIGCTVRVYDVSGKIVEEFEITDVSNNQLKINFQNLAKGFYIVKIEEEQIVKTFKILKE